MDCNENWTSVTTERPMRTRPTPPDRDDHHDQREQPMEYRSSDALRSVPGRQKAAIPEEHLNEEAGGEENATAARAV